LLEKKINFAKEFKTIHRH